MKKSLTSEKHCEAHVPTHPQKRTEITLIRQQNNYYASELNNCPFQ